MSWLSLGRVKVLKRKYKAELRYCWFYCALIMPSCKSARLFLHCTALMAKGWELNSASTLASQPAADHSLSFIITIVIMTLGWGLFVGLAAESCSRIWLPCLSHPMSGLATFCSYNVGLSSACLVLVAPT